MNPAMRKSTVALLLFLTGLLFILLTAMDASKQRDLSVELLNHRAIQVKELGLSDLALFTEARYTRHLTLADRHSAFQDHPTSFDHFPSGSLYLPPAHLARTSYRRAK